MRASRLSRERRHGAGVVAFLVPLALLLAACHASVVAQGLPSQIVVQDTPEEVSDLEAGGNTLPAQPPFRSSEQPTQLCSCNPLSAEGDEAAADLGVESVNIARWMRGMSLSPRWEEFYRYGEFKAAVDRIAETNANFIALVIPLVQDNVNSTEIRTRRDTPADDVLTEGIQYIHSKCMGVMLKPHLLAASGEWQANIDPADREAWFESYGAHIKHYAALAEQHGVEALVIGHELNKMANANWNETNTNHWRRLIAEVRQIYSGLLTYSGQWGPTRYAVDNIEFFDDLDFIGISAFYSLDARTDEVWELREAWDKRNRREIRPLWERFGKPIVFTEVGYRNQDGARLEPWDDRGTSNDLREQANLYEALMSYWSEFDYFGGMFWWEWREDLSPGNSYYTPNDKPAEQVMTEWFSKGVPDVQRTRLCAPSAETWSTAQASSD